MFYILFRIFVLSRRFFLKILKSFSKERDPAGVSLNNFLESLIGVDNPLFAFIDGLRQNLKSFSK